jgi:large repetitive protein
MKAQTLLCLLALASPTLLWSQGLPDQAWPAGTYLSHWDHGGRIVTYHNGYLYLGATDNQHTSIYDISDPTSPQLMHNFQVGNNGHTWHKIGNAFWRSYWNPELGDADVDDPFVDLSDMLNWQPFTGTVHDFPFQSPPATWPGNWLSTYPYMYVHNIYDARLGWWPPVSERNLQQEVGVSASNRWRLGNLLFFTPGDDQSGMAVFDIGDPENPVLLDTLTGNIRQYTNAWQIWRNYVVLMDGDNTNGPDGNANALIIDISDPTNLSIAATVPYDDLPGRYVHFQDEYAFAGRFNRGTKFNMETLTVERVFTPPSGGFGDFQWVPLGHLLLVSSSEINASRSYLFAHQDGLDTTPPTIGYHLPVDGALNQPVTTVIGLVINEVLDSTTVDDQTIQVRPVDDQPIAGVVIDSNYDVVNFVPVEPLLPDTTYEVRIVAGGIHDVAGNAIEEYVFYFSTGNDLEVELPLEVSAIAFDPDTPVTTGVTVSHGIEASGGSGTLEFRWNFGDGSPDTGWVAGLSEADHTYAQPGTFTAQVQVRDQDNQLIARTRRIVVEPIALAAAPTRSDSIAVDENTRQVWVVNPDHGSVAAFHADSLTPAFEQAVCDNPRSLALDDQGRPWVACRDDDRIVRLNPDTGQPAAHLETGRGSAPEAVVFTPDGQLGLASLAGSGQILAFNPATDSETARAEAGPQPHALAVNAGGSRLWVTRLVSDNDNHGSILQFDLPDLTASGTIELPIDTTSPDSGTAGRGLPNYVAALAASPDDTRVWYTAKKDNILRGQWREGTELTFETLVRTMTGSIDTGIGEELISARQDLDDSSMALALAPSPNGAHLFVALAGNNRIVALDPWQGQEIQRLDVGFTPRGLAFDAPTGRLFVRNDLDRSVSVVDAADLVTTGQASLAVIDEVPTTTAEVLAPDVLAGKRFLERRRPAHGR